MEDNTPFVPQDDDNNKDSGHLEHIIPVSGLYQDWFLDYASYVILERAVPALFDGLKPVQRRILHSMNDLDDGRYNKVANIIGHTMKYHPHGDASIGDALVQLGQKDLLIDCQGNWGNILTGDGSAAPRYIEARLSKFAKDVVFNPKTTKWQASYDGRNREPINLPIKFPLLLAQGGEGIAVGLSCKSLPHNFIELIDASINHLRGEDFTIYPDFPTGGSVDVSNYNDGERGGKIKVRAKLRVLDKKTIVIDDIPFGTTTGSLIESIIRANDKGKIKIRKIDDNTAEFVEIMIHLATGVSPDQMLDALYAFTDCEVSISPNAVIIENDKPHFTNVKEILRRSTDRTVDLLKLELQIRLGELESNWHYSSLEKIFIENRIYRDIEECETWEAVIQAIDKGLEPFYPLLKREVTEEDLVRLTEIKIKRISKFDAFKADELIKGIEDNIKDVKKKLRNLIDHSIAYFEDIRKRYSEGKERKTEIRHFESIEATKVVVNNKKLYVNREEGFVGYGLKKEEYISECSDIDDVIVFLRNGKMIVSKVSDKAFFGKDILHVAVWKKGDKRTVYNMVYQDGKSGPAMVKRFSVTSITRDKDYDLTAGNAGSKVLYFTSNPNGEAELINILLRPRPHLKKLRFEKDFSELAIKGRAAKGNILSKHLVSKITCKEEGKSTLAARSIWYDETVKRLNTDDRGVLIGKFSGEDKILAVYKSGTYKLYDPKISIHFEDEELLEIKKFESDEVANVVYWDSEKKQYNAKRFYFEENDKLNSFIGDLEDNELLLFTFLKEPKLSYVCSVKGELKEPVEVVLSDFIGVKGMKAQGNRLVQDTIENFELTETFVPEVEESDESTEEEIDEDDLDDDGQISLF
jgi:topoisomerase-4 subunit A